MNGAGRKEKAANSDTGLTEPTTAQRILKMPGIAKVPGSPKVPGNPKVLVVAPDEPRTTDGVVLSSLEAAVQALKNRPEAETIELRYQQRVERPLTISAPSETAEITIRAADGHSPLIIFRPTSGELLSDHSMIQLIGGKVNFEGVHFRLEIAEPLLVNEWSLFDLKQVKNVSFRQCTLTIRNDFDATASFFYVEGAAFSRMISENMPVSSRLTPTIDLTSCVVRGPASLVRAVEGLPFRVSWEQGFLATSQPAIYARGLSDTGGAQTIELRLKRVTASVQDKLCLIDLGSSAPYVPGLKIDCDQCVFDIRREDMPLVEHRGVDSIDALVRNHYTQTGGSNRYGQSLRHLWRIVARDGETREFGWRPSADWYQERASDKETPWRTGLPSEGRTVDTYLFRDFLLIREQASMAGFDEMALPEPREPLPETTSNAPATMPPGITSPGTMPPGTMPPGTMPPGTMPPGTMPPGTMPPIPPSSPLPPNVMPTLPSKLPLPSAPPSDVLDESPVD